jgi:hypothetical protein
MHGEGVVKAAHFSPKESHDMLKQEEKPQNIGLKM